MATDKPIYISLEEVLSNKLGSRSRFIPGWVVRWLEKVICQEQMNALLRDTFPAEGADFCRAVLHRLDISAKLVHPELLPTDSRCIFISNHPLGGLDGMIIIAILSSRYPDRTVRFIVNDLLMAIKPLSPVFVPVNKHGAQSRSSRELLDEVMAGDDPVVIFPAGLVSRKARGGAVKDLEWKKMFASKAAAHRRDVVPMYIDGQNSPFFYNFARWREKSGLKLNIEMVRLPAEVFRCGGTTFPIVCGSRIPWQFFTHSKEIHLQATIAREMTYSLAADAQQPGEIIHF